MKHETNPNAPSAPIVETSNSPYGDSKMECTSIGLTKREKFAAMAMQGLLSNSDDWTASEVHLKWISESATQYADALIKALNE